MCEEKVGPQTEQDETVNELEGLKTPLSLRDTPPSQGESLNSPQASSPVPQVSQKTQGVKPSRSSAMGVLQSAAKKAAISNSRSDVHEYMRIRRGYV